MELEFDCGTVVQNVGEPIMAMNHHITVCAHSACIEDVQSFLSQWEAIQKVMQTEVSFWTGLT